jgi:hypothetical protein
MHAEPLAAFVRRKVVSTSVLRDLPDVSVGTVETEGAPRPPRRPAVGCGYVADDRIVNPAGPNQRHSVRRAPVTRLFTPQSAALRSALLTEKRTVSRGNERKLQESLRHGQRLL